MHPLFLRTARLSLPLFLASLTLATPAARAQSTNWIGGFSDWGTGASWSNGEPTAGVDAIFNAVGTSTVSLAGETCRNLILGTSGAGVTLRVVAGGSLAVVHRFQVPMASAGTVQQQGGAVSADSLVLGATSSIGQYVMSGGTLTVGTLLVGTAQTGSVATFSTLATNPAITVNRSLTIGRGGNMVSGAGTLTVGSSAADSLVVLGAFQMANRPTVMVRNFAMHEGSGLSALILFNGITPVISSGAAILNGLLTVTEVGAPNGTYELVRGNPLSGTFDLVALPPTGDWSWRIEGNSLLATKGMVAVEPTTWSGVKAGNFRN